MKVVAVLMAVVCLGAAVPVLPQQDEVSPGPPQPYSFTYTAGRYPGHVDRTHSEQSDGTGVIRGMFAYVDPRHQVRTVEYVADAEGFHPVLSNPVADTPTVAAAKVRHADLYARIAAEHARIAAERGPDPYDEPQQLHN
ncbi:cuticle protein 10.9-like [Periplaneta americana]|uniref:cuticle protein 10.9-like n=1 Tax=Periplaneta americana TaxID=6978 RepID=UPI0037E8CE5D